MAVRRPLLALALVAAVCAPVAMQQATAAPPVPLVDPTVPALRDTEPVVTTGTMLGDWAVPHDLTLQLPLNDLSCHAPVPDLPPLIDSANCGHNKYAKPLISTQEYAEQEGQDISLLSGWRWDGAQFREVPLQVDEVWTRYIQNNDSDFGIYSGQDQHTTYAYDRPGDREGFRFTTTAPGNSCLAVEDPNYPSPMGKSDPVKGLDTNDEIAFMASDLGGAAPATAALPIFIQQMRRIQVVDPGAPGTDPQFMYVGYGKPPAFDGSTGYVRYERDANSDVFVFSESNYEGYGAAAHGPYCDEAGTAVIGTGQRRPLDRATITTNRYKFRYDGRWLMTELHISPDNGVTYGPDLIDRWKARAFAQDPGSETPCCGYEDEDVNWGGSSILLGEHVGPVRAIRETWGADSGTNVIRRETFYREEMRQHVWLRVHPIPPLDGIYSQWDHNAGIMTRFITPQIPSGVPVDGSNDEVFGNFDDPCNSRWANIPRTDLDDLVYTVAGIVECETGSPYHLSIDVPDLTQFDVNAALSWTEITGPHGTIVSRYQADPTKLTPGGFVQSLLAVPYYRDEACFDDGTGTDPGPHLKGHGDEGPGGPGGRNTLFTTDGNARRCWAPLDGPTGSDERFLQGSIGTYGVHLLAVVESDNARLQLPLTEITTEQRQVYLPGQRDWLAGEQYGRGPEKPLVVVPEPDRFGG